MWNANVRPVHNALQTVETTGQHTVFGSDYNDSTKTYQDLVGVQTVPAHSSLKTSGYQVLLTSFTPTACSVQADEVVTTLDELVLRNSLLTSDFVDATDSAIHNPQQGQETGDFAEEVIQHVRIVLEDSLVVTDSATALQHPPAVGLTDVSGALDSVVQRIRIMQDEVLGITDGTSEHRTGIDYDQEFDWGIKIRLRENTSRDDGINIRILQAQSEMYGIEQNISNFSLVPVTNASSASNPFAPTLVIGGNVIYQGSGNPPPPNAAYTTGFVKYLDNGIISGLGLCNFFNFGFTLDYGGGNWAATATNLIGGSVGETPIQTLGRNLTFFGLNAFIYSAGMVVNSSSKGYKASGGFGQPKLYKQLNLVAYGDKNLNQLVSAPNFNQVKLTGTNSLKSAALAIARQVGIELEWNVRDYPYTSTIQEAGDTVVGALSSLAARAGATLRWNGNNKYRVAYPDRCFGKFDIPDCSVIAAGGLENDEYLDLDTGATGTGVQLMHKYPEFDTGTGTVPRKDKGNTDSASGGSPTVTMLGKIKTKLTSDDPPIIFDLPQDYDQVYIQILVAPGKTTTGANQIDVKNFMTTDPTKWFSYGHATLTGGAVGSNTEFIYTVNLDGASVPQVKVDYRAFPDNDSVNANNFVMTLACTRKSLPIDNSQKKKKSDEKEALGQQQDVYRFAKTFSGRINFIFFGAIPLPGMCVDYTFEGVRVHGVIESVQFTFPGFITIDVANYKRISFTGQTIEYGEQFGTPLP